MIEEGGATDLLRHPSPGRRLLRGNDFLGRAAAADVPVSLVAADDLDLHAAAEGADVADDDDVAGGEAVEDLCHAADVIHEAEAERGDRDGVLDDRVRERGVVGAGGLADRGEGIRMASLTTRPTTRPVAKVFPLRAPPGLGTCR